jgi:methionyl-tRNA synthetase
VREMVFGLDSNFSEEALIERYNADLANDLGNLVSRSTRMVAKYFDGVLPGTSGSPGPDERELRELCLRATGEYRAKMEGLELHNAMVAAWSLISYLNKYIDRTAPWTLAKSDRERLAAVMYHLMEGIRLVAEMVYPVMPGASEKILATLGLNGAFTSMSLSEFGKLPAGAAIGVPEALFPRVERLKKPEQEAQAPAREEEQANLIDIADFARCVIRVGKILEASRVDKSEKLVKLRVDVGSRTVQIAAGIARDYTPEELTGKHIAVVTNLKPAKLMGIESQGMLLATDTREGKLSLLTFDREPKVGARVR